MKVFIQQVDMDACLTALILGVSPDDEIVAVRSKAAPEDLADPEVLCIECGGSSRVELNDFDHHDTAEELPPACEQAFALKASRESKDSGLRILDSRLERLVDYVALLDVSGPEALKRVSGLKGAFPTLSDVFSGMRLSVKDPREQLVKGMEILRLVLERGLDPFGLMPELPEWQGYLEAKWRNDAELKRAKARARIFTTKGGLKAGYLETSYFGALGVLYELGCQVAIAYSPRFGHPSVKKYTIGGNGIRVDSLLPLLNARDPGWGGPAHGTVIGSPREEGSRLQPEELIALVRKNL